MSKAILRMTHRSMVPSRIPRQCVVSGGAVVVVGHGDEAVGVVGGAAGHGGVGEGHDAAADVAVRMGGDDVASTVSARCAVSTNTI